MQTFSENTTVRLGNSHVLVRSASLQDAPTLADILTVGFYSQTGVWGLIYPLVRLGIYEDLRQRLRGHTPYYVCLAATLRTHYRSGGVGKWGPEQIAGTVEMSQRTPSPWESRGGPYLYVSNLAVKPTFRRCGVASQLLLACDRVAWRWGFTDIYLHVLEENQSARALYEKIGYQLAGMDFSPRLLCFQPPRRLLLRKRIRGEG
jgi:ribosomal protein S18 acetylase RimI-like enzyme